jgi:competence protein ComGF
MIDNIELIKDLLNFENDGDFYMLYVFKRKKDQPEGERDNHQSVRTIKTYCVDSVEYLEKRYDEIKQLCEMFKARAYIHVQKQNHKDVSLEMMVSLAERIRNGQTNQKGLFDSVVGQIKTYEKRWIVDIDSKDNKELLKVKLAIDSCPPFGKDKIISEIPTKNGYHLITERFDVMEFKKHFPELDLQKKNPTLLFLPESLN